MGVRPGRVLTAPLCLKDVAKNRSTIFRVWGWFLYQRYSRPRPSKKQNVLPEPKMLNHLCFWLLMVRFEITSEMVCYCRSTDPKEGCNFLFGEFRVRVLSLRTAWVLRPQVLIGVGSYSYPLTVSRTMLHRADQAKMILNLLAKSAISI